jgi:tight adherence protein B
VRAQAAQARLSGLVIALAPLAFGALAAGTDRRTAHFLLHSPFGSGCLAAGLALDGLAAWWMHRITAVAA